MNIFGIMLLFDLVVFLHNNFFCYIRIAKSLGAMGYEVFFFKLSFQNCRSVDCFRLGWPMRVDSDFFSVPFPQQERQVNKDEVWHIMSGV